MNARRNSIRSFLLIGMTFLGVGLSAWVRAESSTEPAHEGRLLSEWLTDLDLPKGGIGPGPPPPPENTVRVLHVIGAIALPYLLTMLESPDWRMRERCVRAFSIFKEKGEPAMPQLARLCAQERTSNPAFHALVNIGIVTLPILTNALSHANPEIRGRAASYIGMYDDKPESTRAAVPALTKCLTDPEPRVRFWAAHTLSDITLDPSSLVPVLLSTLLESADPFRGLSARDLGKLGVAARPAVPALLEADKENDKYVQPQAAEALRRIERAIDREKAESAQNKRSPARKSERKK